MLASLRDLYQHQLAEFRQAEMKYLETLRTLESAAYSYELGRMIHDQVQHTQEHIRRLDTVLRANPLLQPDENFICSEPGSGLLGAEPASFDESRERGVAT